MGKQATLRFYAELIDFLDEEDGSGRVTCSFGVAPSIKDMIESCGVPHTEVDVIIANGESVDFSYRVEDGDHIGVYPVFESFDVSPIARLRPEPLRETRFVADVHLGKLARFLRLLGFDTLYDRTSDDPALVTISTRQLRILLTRDIELLKHSDLTHGYYVRATDARSQIVEVVRRFHLDRAVEPFTRCMSCNDLLADVDKEAVAGKVPPRTWKTTSEYRQCTRCGKLYWQGSHQPELEQIVESARQAGRR